MTEKGSEKPIIYSAEYLTERRIRYALRKRNLKLHKKKGNDGKFYYALYKEGESIKDIWPPSYHTLDWMEEHSRSFLEKGKGR